jgi:hypothetical protein
VACSIPSDAGLARTALGPLMRISSSVIDVVHKQASKGLPWL